MLGDEQSPIDGCLESFAVGLPVDVDEVPCEHVHLQAERCLPQAVEHLVVDREHVAAVSGSLDQPRLDPLDQLGMIVQCPSPVLPGGLLGGPEVDAVVVAQLASSERFLVGPEPERVDTHVFVFEVVHAEDRSPYVASGDGQHLLLGAGGVEHAVLEALPLAIEIVGRYSHRAQQGLAFRAVGRADDDAFIRRLIQRVDDVGCDARDLGHVALEVLGCTQHTWMLCLGQHDVGALCVTDQIELESRFGLRIAIGLVVTHESGDGQTEQKRSEKRCCQTDTDCHYRSPRSGGTRMHHLIDLDSTRVL